MAVPTLLYGAGTWTLTKKEERIIESIEMRFLRSIAGISLLGHQRNEDIKRKLKIYNINDRIKSNKNNWKEHIERMDEERFPKVVLCKMNKYKKLSSDLKTTYCRSRPEGIFFKKNRANCKQSHITVQYIVNTFKCKNSVENIPRKSKRMKLSKKEERAIVRQVKSNPMSSKLAQNPECSKLMIPGLMDKEVCVSILKKNVKQSAAKLGEISSISSLSRSGRYGSACENLVKSKIHKESRVRMFSPYSSLQRVALSLFTAARCEHNSVFRISPVDNNDVTLQRNRNKTAGRINGCHGDCVLR
ncbi:hypothetical protein ANN_23563 [Periplaneta americana]|uniref:Uncharacterized protein n=1 Tax=Periplaneta americana TaxID=6978 RepID=A0ABQ8SMP7_PERAM|nr:hypothetical protein ANN_23563 [Periplaneta americana]